MQPVVRKYTLQTTELIVLSSCLTATSHSFHAASFVLIEDDDADVVVCV